MSGKTSNNKKFIEYSRISNFALCSIAIILIFLPSSFGETDFWTASNPSLLF
jgi:hypothetical protein